MRLDREATKRLQDDRRTRVSSLDGIWKAAGGKARALNMSDYGVLVVRDREGELLVFVEEQSPEKMYTQWECR